MHPFFTLDLRWYLGSALRSGKLKIGVVREENNPCVSNAVVNGYGAVNDQEEKNVAAAAASTNQVQSQFLILNLSLVPLSLYYFDV